MPAYYLELIVVGLGLALLMLEAFLPRLGARGLATIGATGLLVVLFLLPVVSGAPGESGGIVWKFYIADNLALFYKGLALITTILVLIMSVSYARVMPRYLGTGGGVGEYLVLPVFTCAGLMWMASANDLTSIFVSLEVVTIGFYVMVAYMRRNVGSIEAGVKYLVLGALSTGFLVYGIAFLFGITGQTNLDDIATVLAGLENQDRMILFAFCLLLVALGFKVAAVPFHMWVPDVYQGAPTPTTAFLSVGSKAAGFIVLTRIVGAFLGNHWVEAGDGSYQERIQIVLLLLAGLTIVVGSLAAIAQTNLKRLLGYSSISHAGFILLALACAYPVHMDMASGEVVAFYLAAYLPVTMTAFLVLCIVRGDHGDEEIASLDGLGKRSPLLAFVLLIAVMGLAGIPLTVGFLGKFFVFQVALDQGHYALLGLAIVGAAAGFYYYFKVVRALYWNAPPEGAATIVPGIGTRILLVTLAATIIFLGLSPGTILALLR
jgi:NADH-quinone oxidoreductase subunit N